MKSFFKSSGLILLYMGIYLIFQLMVVSVFTAIYTFIQGFKYAFDNKYINQEQLFNDVTNTVNKNTALFIIISAIGAFLFYMLISKIRKRSLFKLCEFKKISLRNAINALLIGISANVLTIVLISFLPIEKLTPEYEELMESINGGNFIVTLLGVGIVAPIIEEIIFRGLIYHELKRHMPILLAVVIQALLFGIYHFNIVQGIYAFFLGIILALALNWTDTIWSAILIHFSYNTFSTVINYFVEESFLESSEAAMLTGIIVFASLVIFSVSSLYLWRNRKINRQVKEHNDPIAL